jgi:hypothetical protein
LTTVIAEGGFSMEDQVVNDSYVAGEYLYIVMENSSGAENLFAVNPQHELLPVSDTTGLATSSDMITILGSLGSALVLKARDGNSLPHVYMLSPQ